VGHEPVAEIQQPVEVVAPGEKKHHGEGDGRTHRRGCYPVRDAGRYPADDVPGERVEVGAAGEVLEVDRSPEGERGAELEEGEDRFHIDPIDSL
jgi:hypothetical protein